MKPSSYIKCASLLCLSLLFVFCLWSSYDGSRAKVFMLAKTSLTQSTKPINNVTPNQNKYSKKMNNERPENGTSWYSFMTNTGFEAFLFTRGREKREKGREAGGKGTGGGKFWPPCPPPPPPSTVISSNGQYCIRQVKNILFGNCSWVVAA